MGSRATDVGQARPQGSDRPRSHRLLARATKKKLMRHANEERTDGYAHAELAEMLEALERLPTTGMDASEAALTGTGGSQTSALQPVARAHRR